MSDQLQNSMKEKIGEAEISSVRVLADSITTGPPESWSGPKPQNLPALKTCQAAWKRVEKASVELESSGRGSLP